MRILTELCSVPTAPFAEQYVVRYVERFVKARKGLKLSRDTHGNLLIELPGRSKKPRWVFGAHMDHPGFVADRMLDAKTLQAHFRGWVLPEFFVGSKVRFFNEGGGEVAGVIEETARTDKDLNVPSLVRVRVKGEVEPGVPGMWDQGESRVKGGKFYSRVCDDLAGAAAALTMLDQLYRKPPESPVAVLLTRAEEAGFIGAIAAVLEPKLLRKTDRIVAIETSAMQPYAPQGNGVILRIGDRTSIFNSALTYFLGQQADDLGKRVKGFKYQRALMPGGTCEATVYDIYGYISGAVCVALGNYHNMNRDKGRIEPEYIDVNDWTSMVRWFVHLAKTGHAFEPGHAVLREKVEKRFDRLKHLF